MDAALEASIRRAEARFDGLLRETVDGLVLAPEWPSALARALEAPSEAERLDALAGVVLVARGLSEGARARRDRGLERALTPVLHWLAARARSLGADEQVRRTEDAQRAHRRLLGRGSGPVAPRPGRSGPPGLLSIRLAARPSS